MSDRGLAGVVGSNLKRLRQAWGGAQADLANTARMHGLAGWRRDTVASAESGRRAISIDELLILAHIFSVSVGEFFVGAGPEDFARTPHPSGYLDPTIDLSRVRALLEGGKTLEASNADLERQFREAEDRVDQFFESGEFERLERRVALRHSSVEEIAGERFAASPRRVQNAADKLWGRSTHDEFVARVESRAPEDTPRRSFDAIRGHVTRELLRELGEILTKKGGR